MRNSKELLLNTQINRMNHLSLINHKQIKKRIMNICGNSFILYPNVFPSDKGIASNGLHWLVTEALPECNLLDMGCGAGVLGILFALRWCRAKVIMIDNQKDAIENSKENVSLYKLQKRVKIMQSDLFSALSKNKSYYHKNIDVIVFNHPLFPYEKNIFGIGGKNGGRKILYSFFKNVFAYVKDKGEIYVPESEIALNHSPVLVAKDFGYKCESVFEDVDYGGKFRILKIWNK